MKCPECNADIAEGGRFCSSCGAKAPPKKEKAGLGGIHVGDVGYMEGGVTDASMHGSASVGNVNINVGQPDPRVVQPSPSLVECPLCGRQNELGATFRCRKCGRNYLCLRHQDEKTFLCGECMARERPLKKREAASPPPVQAGKQPEVENDISLKGLSEQQIATPEPPIPKKTGKGGQPRKSLSASKGDTAKKQPSAVPEAISGTIVADMDFVHVPAGKFMMGDVFGNGKAEEQTGPRGGARCLLHVQTPRDPKPVAAAHGQ